jgi:hypothetical protein
LQPLGNGMGPKQTLQSAGQPALFWKIMCYQLLMRFNRMSAGAGAGMGCCLPGKNCRGWDARSP